MDALVNFVTLFLLASSSAIPLLFGTGWSLYHLRKGARTSYLQHVSASIVSGAVVLLVLWGSLFGDDLSSSSTAALLFVAVPGVAVVVHAIAYVISCMVTKTASASDVISPRARAAILIPIAILAVLLFGFVKVSIQ